MQRLTFGAVHVVMAAGHDALGVETTAGLQIGHELPATVRIGSQISNGVHQVRSIFTVDTVAGRHVLAGQITNLGILEAGDRINIEGDMIGKYVGRVLASRDD